MLGITTGGVGLAGGLGLIAGMEAGVPIPLPSDLLLLVLGERAAAGSFPLWAAALGLEVAALAGTALLFLLLRRSGLALVRRFGSRVGLTEERVARATSVVEGRGRAAVAVGRMTPGLRTVTVLAAATSRLPSRVALAMLAVGSSVFVQGHLLLGYYAGPAARRAVAHAGAILLLVLAASAVAGLLLWTRRRRGRAGLQAWAEASCPACLVLGALGREPAAVAGAVRTP
jgi:membrane protein DedA with SNARE-associated domain